MRVLQEAGELLLKKLQEILAKSSGCVEEQRCSYFGMNIFVLQLTDIQFDGVVQTLFLPFILYFHMCLQMFQ